MKKLNGWTNEEDFIVWFDDIFTQIKKYESNQTIKNLFTDKESFFFKCCPNYKYIWRTQYLIWEISK